ncbi:MAG: succinylglutamate desuccinylase/aspartoacylase family protein, partial [Bosea sp. (in: a-proteobacteria)]
MRSETLAINGATPGTQHALTVQRFGRPGARPQIYIQASLHADEIPGMICAHHLREKLLVLEAANQITGEIVLVPMANPLGLTQVLHGHQIGRFALEDGGNFNRDFPDLVQAAIDFMQPFAKDCPDTQMAMARAALAQGLDALSPVRPQDHFKQLLLGMALQADLVLDLHCDAEAVSHLYTLPSSAEVFEPLSRLLGAQAVLLADVSGGNPFDEAVSRPWAELADRGLAPQACHAVTVELRGQADVSHAQGAADADAIIAFLTLKGAISGPMRELPEVSCQPTPLAACEVLTAPSAGMLVYHCPVGALVSAGQPVCDIVDPLSGDTLTLHAESAGVLFARSRNRFAQAGMRLGKIAGNTLSRT